MSGPNIVTNGLILNLHAAQATGTGPGTNSPSTNTWNDLTGNYNSPLSNFLYTPTSGWAGNGTLSSPYSLNFDGVDDLVQVTPNGIGKFDLQNFTIEVWSMPTLTANRPLFSYDYTSAAAPYYSAHLRQASTGISFGYNIGGTYNVLYHAFPTGYNSAQYNQTVVSFTSGSQALYSNGANLISGTVPGAITYYSTPVNIGKSIGNSSKLLGGISIVRYYNRVLSPSEILQNYNAGLLWSTDITTISPISQSTVLSKIPLWAMGAYININKSSLLVDSKTPHIQSGVNVLSGTLNSIMGLNNINISASFLSIIQIQQMVSKALNPNYENSSVINGSLFNSNIMMLSPTPNQQTDVFIKASSTIIIRNTSSKIIKRLTSSEVII